MRQLSRHTTAYGLAVLALSAAVPAASARAQEPCAAGSEWEIPGIVQDRATHTAGAQDWKIPPAQVQAMLGHARGLIDLLLRPDFIARPRGMQIGYYRAVGSPTPGTSTLDKQPYPLHVEAMIFSFGCAGGKVTRRWTDADAGLSIDTNSLFDILEHTGMTLDGRKVYKLHLDLGEHRGHRLFMPPVTQPLDASRVQRSVLVAREGRLPFAHVSRKQVLDYLRAQVESASKVETERAASTVTIRPREEQEAEKERRIAEIQSYAISDSAKKARIERLLADHKTDEQRRDEAVARQSGLFAARLKRLDTIQSGYTAAQFQEPAVVPGPSDVSYSVLDRDDWNFVSPAVDLSVDCYPRCRYGQYLVTLDDGYYDPSLPRSAPQVFVVTLGWRDDPKSVRPSKARLRDESLALFDFAALEAMLRKSPAPVTRPGG